MVANDDLEDIVKRQIKGISNAEAVADCAKYFDAPFFETSDDLVEGGPCLITAMVREPGTDSESAARTQTIGGNGIVVEIIREVSLYIAVNTNPVCQCRKRTWNPLRAKSSARRRELINWWP